MRSRAGLVLGMLLTALLFAGQPVSAADSVTLLYERIQDSNGDAFHEKSVRLDYRPFYAVGYLGNWQTGVEVGGYVSDRRRSSYSASVRHRLIQGSLAPDQTVQLDTEQVLANGVVAKFLGRYHHVGEPEPPDDDVNFYMYGLGLDKYYGDYNYFSAMYFNDPREVGRFSVVLSHTLATRDSYFRVGLVPRSDHKTGYFAVTKYHWILLGYTYERHFDFTTFDRRVFTVGLQIPFDQKWSHEE